MSADLIKRLEDAAEGTQELSAEIARDVVGHKIHDWPLWIETKSRAHDFSALAPCPAYTNSLEDALTLVPLGWSWRVSVSENHLYPIVVLGRSYPTNAQVAIEHHTVALAVCVAALKAMERP